MLEVKNLSIWLQHSKQPAQRILNDIIFSIANGEVVALIGESGSGKTITALSLLRLLANNFGYSAASSILLHNNDILNIPEHAMRKIRGADVAMIFQDPMTSLNPVLTVGSQILEVLRLHRNIKGKTAYLEVMRLFDAVQLTNPARQFYSYPHELSGGMQQRVMIAMALACKPSLLIADEPTTALDVTTQAQILALLKELQQQEQMAMLLITHDLAVASQLADTIVVMKSGEIVEQANCRQFFAGPKHIYSQQLLNAVPRLITARPVVQSNATTIMQVSGLKVYFPIKSGLLRRTVGYVKAVDGVDFELQAGKTLAIVGESGSGKTTLAKAIAGLIPSSQGAVQYIGDWHKKHSDLQVIFQNPYSALNPKLRIIESFKDGAGVTDAKIDALLSKVGLQPEYKWRYPHEFSGGERQRLCIARALTVDPKVIICDEPTSSLDVSVQAQVLKLLQDLQSEHNIAYLFISHDLKVVSAIAHNVAVMHAGKIIEYGATYEVLTNPQQEYTKNLLAAVPRIS
jgi:peptide/nickel transport system ATP-binding protein